MPCPFCGDPSWVVADHLVQPITLGADQTLELGTGVGYPQLSAIIECADAELALLLAHDRRLRSLCRIADQRYLVFRAADEPTVRRALRELGYAIPPAAGSSLA